MEYIHRSIEKVVLNCDKTFKCVLITGARQSGKSTMIMELFKDRKFITFDDPFARRWAKEDSIAFINANQPPVIFDEVQGRGDLFSYIKMECDKRHENGLYCLSGSQSFALMRDVSESLAGRVAIVELNGLSLREIKGDPFDKAFLPTVDYIRERSKSAKPLGNIWEIIHRGSYPALQNQSVDWTRFYSSYIQTYLERDVRSLSTVHSLDDFHRFMVATAARSGQILNIANIASDIGKDEVTIKRWLTILEASHIIYLLEPYNNSLIKRTVKAPKLYFKDAGLVAYLTRWPTPEALAIGATSGSIYETFVVSEILKSYANLGLDYRYGISYFRNREGKEIDLIIEENGTLYPIEIKQTSDPNIRMASAFKILEQTDKKIGSGAIICNCSMPAPLDNNIFAIPVEYI